MRREKRARLRQLLDGAPEREAGEERALSRWVLDDAEDVLGGFEDAEAGQYIRGLLDSKMLYGSWCCSRTNFHHPGATAFFDAPPRLPLGREATTKREARGY